MALIDLNSLDSAVHGQVRLGIVAALRVDGPLDFTTLKKRLIVTDGSLGMHLQKLEEAGYVSSRQRFIGKRPNTTYRLTAAGQTALKGYLENMQRLIDAIDAAK